MTMIRLAWHLLRRSYYGAALRHLSTFDPMSGELAHVLLEHERSARVIRGEQ